MPFSSIPGSVLNQPGIIAPSYATSFGFPPIDYVVHQLTARSLRVAFSSKVILDLATVTSSYILSPISSGTFTPTVIEVRPYEPDDMQFELVLSAPLTATKSYSMQITGISDLLNQSWVSSAGHNFTANVKDGPQAYVSYLYEPGKVIILLDQNVGENGYFNIPTVHLCDALNLAINTTLTVDAWSAFQPKNSVVCSLNVSIPSANGYVIRYSGAMNNSLNVIPGDQFVPLSLPQNTPRPCDYTVLTQIRLSDSYITDLNRTYDSLTNSYGNLHLCFSIPPNASDISNATNIIIDQLNIHIMADTVAVVSPNAVDFPTLETLLNEIRSKFNVHVSSNEFHYQVSSNNLWPETVLTDQNYLSLTSDFAFKYFSHKIDDEAHNGGEAQTDFYFSIATNLSEACAIANTIKQDYNSHRTQVTVSSPLISTYVPNSSILTSFSQSATVEVDSAYAYKVIVKTRCISPKTRYLITLNNIQDSSSATTLPSGPYEPRTTTVSSLVHDFHFYPDRYMSVQVPGHVNSVSVESLQFTHTSGLTPEFSASIQSLSNTLLNIGDAFEKHHLAGSPVHSTIDITNFAPGFLPTLPIATICSYANVLRDNFLTHAISSSFHFNIPDYSISLPEAATDENSLRVLTFAMLKAFNDHVFNDFIHRRSCELTTTNPYDRVLYGTGYLKNMELVSGFISTDSKYSNNYTGSIALNHTSTEVNSIAFAKLPYEAAALPTSGLRLIDGEEFLFLDQVWLYFSKPMLNDSDTRLNGVVISGPSISITNRSYATDTKAVLTVLNSLPVSYSLTAAGVKDIAGNEVP